MVIVANKNNTSCLVLAFLVLGLWVASLGGCTSFDSERASGADKDRIGAVAIELNELYLDDVTCLDGDKTDWKFFTVPGEADVAVTFAFDDPSANGTVVIRKDTGEEVKRTVFVPGARTQTVFHAFAGYYYLEIFCQASASEYSIEVSIVE